TNVVGIDVITLAAVLLVMIFLCRQIWLWKFDLLSVVIFFAAIPMLTPFLTEFFGYEYFTAKNYALQQNDAVIAAAVFLTAIFTIAVYCGGRLKLPRLTAYRQLRLPRIIFDTRIIIITFTINFFL